MSVNEIKLLQRKLDAINSAISGLLMLVMDDFLKVTKLAKRVSGVGNNDTAMHTSNLVKELQYYDILHQKANHMKIVHCWIEDDLEKLMHASMLSRPDSTNALRLNQLQYQVWVSCFIQAATNIQSLLGLHEQEARNMGVNNHNIFVHIDLIRSANRLIDSAFTDAVAFTHGWATLCLREKVAAFTSLYSTASERHVLEEYLKNPSVEFHELTLSHVTSRENDIDLF